MGIELRVIQEKGEEEFIGPVIICDRCEQPILEGTGGIYMYSLKTLTRDGRAAPIFVHENPCSRIIEQQAGERLSWDHLELFVKWLQNNFKSEVAA